MISAKNYESVPKFVQVMPRNAVASFFPDTVYFWQYYTICYEFSPSHG